jgi:hypothetical protein
MVKTDGTARHMYWIYNFTLSSFSTEGNSTFVFTGVATVRMRGGPVSDVPVTIKVWNMNVLGLWIGPDKVSGHFGSAPIYGTVFQSDQGGAMMGLQSMMGSSPMTKPRT